MIHSSIQTLEINCNNLSVVVLEPWAEEIFVKDGDKVLINGHGPIKGAKLEVELMKDRLIVHGWYRSILDVNVNGLRIRTASGVIEAV